MEGAYINCVIFLVKLS